MCGVRYCTVAVAVFVGTWIACPVRSGTVACCCWCCFCGCGDRCRIGACAAFGKVLLLRLVVVSFPFQVFRPVFVFLSAFFFSIIGIINIPTALVYSVCVLLSEFFFLYNLDGRSRFSYRIYPGISACVGSVIIRLLTATTAVRYCSLCVRGWDVRGTVWSGCLLLLLRVVGTCIGVAVIC